MDLGTSSALTIESVRMALGAAGLRHQVIADNIANANSADHVRMRVAFEAQFAQALAAARTEPDAGQAVGRLQEAAARMEQSTVQGKVQLDEEMAALSANSLRYHALSRALSRYFSIASAIATGSRG